MSKLNKQTVFDFVHRLKMPHLAFPQVSYAAHQRQIEAHPEAVLEEQGGSTAVELSFRDDGDAIAEQVRLVHVMGGQDDCPACAGGKRVSRC